MYNENTKIEPKVNLEMDIKINPKMDTYFLIDWDDTLFPSSFCNKNSIDLKNPNDINNYKLFFIELDKSILILFNYLNVLGTIYIITNACIAWIKTCLEVLPQTKKFIMNNKIRIMSARDIYYKITDNPQQWKINTFQNVIDIIMNNREKEILNIISIGDAIYEYNSLLNLDNYIQIVHNDNKYLLKNIKFITKPDFNEIVDELNVLTKNINNISNTFDYIDINFEINKN